MRAFITLGLIVILLILPWKHYGEERIKLIGTPLIRHYKRTDFMAGRQTWMIEQDVNGLMYFANNDGLLEFDGNIWKIFQLPNRTIIRCIKSDGKGRIYAGGFDEFGYFKADPQGNMIYSSLTGLLPEKEKGFGEIWKIHLTPFGIIFQSFSRIIIVNEDTVEVIEAPEQFHFSYFINGELYIVDRVHGLMRLSLGKLFPVVGTELLRGKEIWGMFSIDDKILIATAGDGIFTYNGSRLDVWAKKTSEILSEDKVFCLSRIGEKFIAFGTIQDGLIITDLQGNIIQAINREQGLQNNTILSMNSDEYGNLWLGLDNGIDYIEINSPLSLLSYQHGLNSGYAAIIHHGIFYLGTNQGVYAADWDIFNSYGNSTITFNLLENTGGQVWVLSVIDEQLFCGHNNGTYLIEGYQAKMISNISGGWNYIQLSKDPGKVIGGTYSGLTLFERVNGSWVFKKNLGGFNESSRDILEDNNGDIWMSHGLKGVFRIELNDRMDSIVETSFYNSDDGLPSDYGTTLFKYKDSVYVTAEQGVYHFNETQLRFIPSVALNKIFSDQFYRRITLDSKGNIWYFLDAKAGVFRLQEDGSYLDISLPFDQISGSFIGGFQFVYPYNEQNVFLGAETGFIHYDPSIKKDYDKMPDVFIRRVISSPSDSVIFQGIIDKSYTSINKIAFRNNSLQFFFSGKDFENPERIEYSTTLIGQEGSWSNWTSQSNREFTNLHEGDYTFKVKARNIYEVESGEVAFTFTVTPPWRRSLMAYALYGLAIVLASLAGLFLLRRKINRSKIEAARMKEIQFKQRENELKRLSLEAEKKVIHLRNEKLREEMVIKDKELANSTLQMIQKNKLLVSLKNDLNHLNSISRDPDIKSQVRSLMKKINKDIDTESQWKVFENHFEKVHEEFLKRIKAEFPDLTPRELKLCAYLRLNISSKEIALLMNISTRGVEINRYRLRRKLNLEDNINLTDFIISF